MMVGRTLRSYPKQRLFYLHYITATTKMVSSHCKATRYSKSVIKIQQQQQSTKCKLNQTHKILHFSTLYTQGFYFQKIQLEEYYKQYYHTNS